MISGRLTEEANRMETIKTVAYILLFGAVIATVPMAGFADRLYTWTDEKGVSHVTRHPPPAGAKNKDVVEYSHRTHTEQQAAAGGREKDDTRQQPAAGAARSQDSGRVEQYREKIRKEMVEKAAVGKNTCHFQAPGRRVYIRVFSTNDYGERGEEIWKGWIEPNQKALVIAPSKTVLYNRRWEEKGPLSGDDLRLCSGGGVIQIPGS